MFCGVYCFNRKNKLPAGGFTMTYLIVPLSVGAGKATQLPVVRSCVLLQRTDGGGGEGQDTIAVFVLVSETASAGALVST